MKHWKHYFRLPLIRRTTRPSQSNLETFALALLTLEILGLARRVWNADGTRSWFATDELEWLASRDYVCL
jgi:hypothetical protein